MTGSVLRLTELKVVVDVIKKLPGQENNADAELPLADLPNHSFRGSMSSYLQLGLVVLL